MNEAGARLLYPLVNLAIMWFLNVFLNILTFIRLIFRADRYFRDQKPDAVILIDYPGLHWWLANARKAREIPVFYYVPPQLWAWAGWRVKKVQRTVDLVLCSLPFEPDWYRTRGASARSSMSATRTSTSSPSGKSMMPFWPRCKPTRSWAPLVAILPGSRTQELTRNLPIMVRAAVKLRGTTHDVGSP